MSLRPARSNNNASKYRQIVSLVRKEIEQMRRGEPDSPPASEQKSQGNPNKPAPIERKKGARTGTFLAGID